jgi:DNA topoisomerase-3
VFGATTKKDGYIEGKGFTFTWAFGHLLQLAPPQAYGFYGWDARHLPMLPPKLKLEVRQVKKKEGGYEDDPRVAKQLEVIRKLFDEATEIIVATDAGREGELIFRYIYYYLKCKKPFKRLWISSQTDAAIKAGFKNLKAGEEYDTLFNSAHCRAQSDWLVGMNATQALSIASGRKGVLSLGRVQTPTLAMICARYLENKEFVPEPFFQVRILVDKGGQVFRAVSKNYKTEAEAQAIAEKVEDVERGFPDGGHIVKVEAKPRKEPPPLLHDLSSMQQEANKQKGFTADQTLAGLQQLYEAKLITYPRTGSRYIGDDVFAGIPGLIASFEGHPQFGAAARELNGAKLSKRSVNAKKVTDHHAILPTGEAPRGLYGDQAVLYDLVAGRMLEAFGKDCVKEITKITVDSGSIFTASGTVIQVPGWRAVFNSDPEEEGKDEENAALPKVTTGERLPVIGKEVVQKQTKPKPLFTEAALLKAMETAGKEIEDEELRQAMKDTGLGTPATRAATIETLLKRDYIVREKKSLVPTATGLAVYAVVKDQAIAQAQLTGTWEKRLEEIRGGASVQAFQEEIRQYTAGITRELLSAGRGLRTAGAPAQ